jgi:hypothetical protein
MRCPPGASANPWSTVRGRSRPAAGVSGLIGRPLPGLPTASPGVINLEPLGSFVAILAVLPNLGFGCRDAKASKRFRRYSLPRRGTDHDPKRLPSSQGFVYQHAHFSATRRASKVVVRPRKRSAAGKLHQPESTHEFFRRIHRGNPDRFYGSSLQSKYGPLPD